MSDVTPEPTAADLRSNFEAQLAERDRQIAFLQAGVDTASPIGQLFVDGYKGTLEPDAVKEAWSAVAPQPAPVTPPITVPTAPAASSNDLPDLDLLGEANTIASQGVVPGTDPGPHPGHAAVKDYWQALHEGNDVEIAEALGLDRILKAGMDGDPRVSLDGRRGGD